ncbi:MAG: ATP-binding protein [Myxococcota bacterium]
MALFRSIRSKLLLLLGGLFCINIAAVVVTLSYNRQLTTFADKQQLASQLGNSLDDYVYNLKTVSEGLFMVAAGAEASGRASVDEAEQRLHKLELMLAGSDWESALLDRNELAQYRDLRQTLLDRAGAIMMMSEALHHDAAALSPEDYKSRRAKLRLLLTDAAALAETTIVRVAELTEQLSQREAQLLDESATLIAKSNLAIAITVAISGLVGLCVILLFARSLNRKITELDNAAQAFGQGQLSRRAQVTAQDELGALARSLNRVADDMQTSSRYTTNILDTMSNGLLVVTADGTIKRSNRAFCQRFLYSEAELLGHGLAEFLDMDEVAADQLLAAPLINHETTLRNRDGVAVAVELSSAPMHTSGANDAHATVFVVTDISERKQLISELVAAKQSAEAATKAKTAFLASMSHELRTPLNGILGYAQILDSDSELTPAQRRALDAMSKGGEHLLSLIDEILDISKIEAGRIDIVATAFHLPQFLDDIATTFRLRAEQKNLRFDYDVLSELPTAVYGDEKRLRQILINLLGNAVKFTDEGRVALKVGVHHGKIRFQVEDTGFGIDPEFLDDVFQPFHRVGDNQKYIVGTGLGLSISKQLAEAMDGELGVTSTRGQGSVFWLTLELPEAAGWSAAADEARQTITGYHGPRRTILVVDDRAENRRLLDDMLSPLGFTVRQAGNGSEALRQVAQLEPDVILMDLRMPIMGGQETARHLREQRSLSRMVVIAVSASAFEEDRTDSIKAGCDDFLAKPIRRGSLLKKLREHLDLDWQYSNGLDDQATAFTGARPQVETVLSISSNEVDALYDMAQSGDILELQRAFDRLEQDDQTRGPFVGELRKLVDNYRISQLCQRLDQLRQSSPQHRTDARTKVG